jgi:hypothetical protein
MHLLVFALGLIGGFAAGLLGIGGGIIMTPLLLYVPPLLGVGALNMKAVAGLTMAQGLAGSLSGVLTHNRFRFVCKRLVTVMGSSIALASLMGALLSKHVRSDVLLGLFALMAIVAAAMMFVPKHDEGDGMTAERVHFNPALAALVAAAVGFLGGMVGQGGAFILIPLMLCVLHIPTRVTIGSSLGIVFFSALAGVVGKLSTQQIPLSLALALVAGALAGAPVGAQFSKATKTCTLRYVLACLIALTALRMGWQVIIK